jgi:hypothetical protein
VHGAMSRSLTFASSLIADGSVMPAMVISYSEESKTATIQFPHTLQAGRYLPPWNDWCPSCRVVSKHPIYANQRPVRSLPWISRV